MILSAFWSNPNPFEIALNGVKPTNVLTEPTVHIGAAESLILTAKRSAAV